MNSTNRGPLSDRIAANGHAFPIDVMPDADAASFRARIESLETGPVGYGLPAQRLFALEVLGYAPGTSLREGLQRLRAWYEAGEWDLEDLMADEATRNWE